VAITAIKSRISRERRGKQKEEKRKKRRNNNRPKAAG